MFNFSALRYYIIVPTESVREIIDMFLVSREEAPNGSSFAVTSSAPSGFRCIYMTDASYKTYSANKMQHNG